MIVSLKNKDEFRLISDLMTSCNSLSREDRGDDCSIEEWNEHFYQITTTDMLLEGTHFLTHAITGYQLGYKSLAVSLSDIAAMGGEPKNVYLSIGLPETMEYSYFQDFVAGFSSLTHKYGLNLCGGDTTKSTNGIVINVLVQGIVEKSNIKKRSAAKAGDLICMTKVLGDSAIGLEIVLEQFETKEPDYFLKKHLEPTPEVEKGLWLAKQADVHGMMDISDGLASDLGHICHLSELGARIHLEHLPSSPQAEKYLKSLINESRSHFLLSAGEDYGLLFTCNPLALKTLQEDYKNIFASCFYVVGCMTEEQGIQYLENGLRVDMTPQGYNHFCP